MTQELRLGRTGKPFHNHAAACVGTGRLGLALQEEYQEHLAAVQKAVRFDYIRGHGLFCRDLGIYRECALDGRTVPFYNFTYVDRIFDRYLEQGVRPFLELGFMPEELASGEETIFYWKGNVTPPADHEKWAQLVRRTLAHFAERYGIEEVRRWPVEVWNEPNIGFWTGGLEGYLRLYDVTARAVKDVDPGIRVGGPAICGVDTERWLRAFFEHCEAEHPPLDFVTRHCYTANEIVHRGHYTYHTMRDPRVMIGELRETRAIMDDYPLTRGMPLHITEFNSSYNPLCPVHDSVFNAAYIARILSEAGDLADSYSYWTFSDVFEESDVPKAVFHGGFGLMALGGIEKPTFHTFEFFARAGGELLYRDENLLVTADEGRYAVLAWRFSGQEAEERAWRLSLPGFGGDAFCRRRFVDRTVGNPVQTWMNMGRPRVPAAEQLETLRAAGRAGQTDGVLHERDGRYEIELGVSGDMLVLLEITRAHREEQEYLGFDPGQFYGLEQL